MSAGTEAAQQQWGEYLVQETAGGGGEGAGDHRLARAADAADPVTAGTCMVAVSSRSVHNVLGMPLNGLSKPKPTA